MLPFQGPTTDENNLMGVLKCIYEKKGRSILGAYKKRFFVVNSKKKALEVYKNDQEPIPRYVVNAEDIRQVYFSGDKENRFFVMLVLLRKGDVIKFRMRSSGERDRWYAALVGMADWSKSTRQGLLQLILHKLGAAGETLGVVIQLDSSRLLDDVPDDLTQYVAEAIDIALETISFVVLQFGQSIQIPKSYTLCLQEWRSTCDACEPHYDPTERLMILHVLLKRDEGGLAKFTVTSPEAVFQIIQSDIFRSPLIEGWIEADPACREICNQIRNFLGVKKFAFSFQWGNLRNQKKVEIYLKRFVNSTFMQQIFNTIQSTAKEVDEFLSNSANTNYVVEVPEATSFARSNPGFRHSFVESSLRPGSLNKTSSVIKIFVENISGLAIRLEPRLVDELAGPPQVRVSRVADYDRRSKHALGLLSKYRQKFSRGFSETVSLRGQLLDIALSADLSRKLSTSNLIMSKVFDRKIKVTIRWGRLIHCFKVLDAPIYEMDLPNLVTTVTELSVQRLQHMRQMLADIMGLSDDSESSLFGKFCQSVYTIVINFLPFDSSSAQRQPLLPDPEIREGVMTDYFICTDAQEQKSLLELIFLKRGFSIENDAEANTLLRNIRIYPSLPRLRAWCETITPLLSTAGKDFLAHRRNNFLDDGANSVDMNILNLGETVAMERSAETQVLTMHSVVNMTYDSQVGSVDLKIGADDIKYAIGSLEQAFNQQRIRKHDIMRIMMSNLQRLRTLYSLAIDGNTTGSLTQSAAEHLLRDFCEYEESEVGITEGLLNFMESRNQSNHIQLNASTKFDDGEPVATKKSSPLFGFKAISWVALNQLLPKEAMKARNASRLVFLFGLENTGKTLIINSLRGVLRPTVPTVGLSQQVVAFNEWVFLVNELGGRECFRKNWKHYRYPLGAVDVLMFVLDVQFRRAHKEAAEYLRSVASHYDKVPLLVVFNNYLEGPRPTPIEMLEELIDLKKIRNNHKKRPCISVLCNITVVHSANKVIPESLRDALKSIGDILMESTPKDRRPSMPKLNPN